MRKIVVVIIILFPVLCRSQSPCPSFFRYMIHEKTKEIYGKLEIPFPPKNIIIHLRVSLSVATALPTRYLGKIELARSKRDSIIAINQNRPLIYNIYFPIARPIPLLTEITFNDHQYCFGPHAIGPAVTNIFLEHYLYPPIIDDTPDSVDEIKLPNQPNDNELFDSHYSNNSLFFTFNNICGKSSECYSHLPTENEIAWPGQWPWIAAIFVVRLEFQFHCVGNLISDRYILTAAHCKQFNGEELSANNFIVSLGRYRLHNWREKSSRNIEVKEFFIHPDYKHYASAHADLGLIILRNKVQFTPTIKPVCLWTGDSNLNKIVGTAGYVVGWGIHGNSSQHRRDLRMTKVPIVSQEECLRSNIGFLHSTSNKTFCAGNKNGHGPCDGDSGSGLVILNQSTGKYYLRGIVSLSLLDRNTSSCNLNEYIVYVDVAKFLDWINMKIKKN